MSYPKNTNLNPQVCKVEIVSMNDVQAIFYGSTRMHRNVVLKSTKTWKTIYATAGKVEFSDEQSEDAGGPYFNQKVEFFYPGEDTTTRQLLYNMENQRLLVLLTFTSGVKKMLGDIGNACLMKSTFSIEKGGRTVTIFRRAAEPAYLV